MDVEDEERNGPKQDEPVPWYKIKVNRIVNNNKEGPWFTQKEHIKDS
jgi:hypothetical protein